MWKVKGLFDIAEPKEGKGEAVGTSADRIHAFHHLNAWLNVHIVRSLTVDLAAWACFAVATAKAAEFE